MAEDKVRQKDFNLHTWFATIPMTDDVYLGLQAQNIARVEISVLRRWESEVLDEQESDPGNYQGPKYRELLALSQMWVFGLYEFLRTWRQRARLLMQFAEKYSKLATQADRDAYLKDTVENAKNKARLATRFPVYYPKHVAKIADPKFMNSVRVYLDKTEQLYQELSAVRMPAAKHELPKRYGQEALIADAPGIGLPDPLTGSICWQVSVGGTQTTILRRNLADKFFGIFGWQEDIGTALLLANEAKTRRKRLRNAALRDARRTLNEAERLDRYFRTEREVKDDGQPFTAMHRQRGRRYRKNKTVKASKAEPLPSERNMPDQTAAAEALPYFVTEMGLPPTDESPRSSKRRYPRKQRR